MATRQGVSSDFGSGGSGLAPGGASGSPDLATLLFLLLARIAAPVANLTALREFGAENTNDRVHGMLALVEGTPWWFDSTSEDVASASTVIPDDEPTAGRWKQLSFATMVVGDPDAGYTSPDFTWMRIDGTNPPTFPAIRLIDQATGTARRVTVSNGELVVT